MDAKNVDTQMNIAIDFKGTRENISISRSTVIGSESSPSLMFVFHVWVCLMLYTSTTAAPNFPWQIL